ncbi:MAG: hypothetical protein O7B80_06205, partial [bacterium]|nr:hypothetical protein [bacterium]
GKRLVPVRGLGVRIVYAEGFILGVGAMLVRGQPQGLSLHGLLSNEEIEPLVRGLEGKSYVGTGLVPVRTPG